MLFRILSSLVIVPLFILLMFKAPLGFRAFLVLGAGLGYEEYRRMLAHKGLSFAPWTGFAALLLLMLPVALGIELPPQALGLGLAGIFVAAALWRVYRPDVEQGALRFFAELSGIFYIGLLAFHMIKLYALPEGAFWVLLVFWYAWVYDSGAMFVGKGFGKTPFNPLSPAKTWEGFWGGIAINALFSGLLLPLFFPPGFPLDALGFAVLSVPASVVGQGGDLFESMLKRFAGVKDSSHLISTHGGFLDKMDSSIFVAPLVYLAATFLQP